MFENWKNDKAISLFSIVLIAVTLLALVTMLLILRSVSARAREIDEMEGNRAYCATAISEFSDASDNMTSNVWGYAADGDISHMESYWTEVEVSQTRDKAIEKLLHSSLTAQERTHVMRAKAYSDALIEGETWSMRMLAESYGVPENQMPRRVRETALQADEEALPAAEKKERAQQYLFGSEYAKSKQMIREMVSAFNADLSGRLADSTAAALKVDENASRYSVAAVVLLMLLVVLLIYTFSRTVGKKNRQLTAALEEAQAASSAKSYFTSRMSHEIRTPLNAVMGYLHLAQTADDPKEREAGIEKSQLAAKNLLGIVNDVLDLSAIESGRMQLSSQPYRVSALVSDLQMVYSGIAESKKLNFTAECGGLLHDTLRGDRMRVNQILTNLMSNAVKFTPEGGSVTLRARQEEGVDGVRTVYTVEDTGIGMSPEFLPHIFDAYEQESAEIHGRFGGSGLGMSIVKNLTDIMGGSVSVESEKDRGSRFTIELHDPAADESELPARPPENAAEKRASEDGRLRGMKILLAEDNEMNREIARHILTRAGAEVTAARDGEEALRAFADAPAGSFDAVLMDIIMPKMNGYEATRAIRASGKADAGEIPIIAMSANAFTSDIQKSLDAGMNAHTAKPIDVKVLLDTLERFWKKKN